MKPLLPFLLIAALLSAVEIRAQDEADSVEATAREALSDSRLREAAQNPGEAVEEAANDPDAAVREATRIFRESQQKLDTPENREKAKALSAAALSRAGQLARERSTSGAQGEQEAATETASQPEPPEPTVPATRSSSTTSEVATPVAMPIGDSAAPLVSASTAGPVVQKSSVRPLPGSSPTESRIPDSAFLAGEEPPEPRPLQPRFNTGKPGASEKSGKDFMEINSRESVFDSKKGVLTFLGNVRVDHPDYDLDCEKLEIRLSGPVGAGGQGSSGQTIRRATATGGMVKIERIGEDGNIQVAFARKADYDAVKQEFVLSGGPPHIQDGDRSVKTNSQDSRIIMRGNGTYEIVGSDAGSKGRNTIVIPVPKNSGSGDMGIGGGLGDSVDQLR